MAGEARVAVADLPQYAEGVQSEDPDVCLEGLRNVRKLLSQERDPPIHAVIEAGLVPLLVRRLRDGTTADIQNEAAWALNNIAAGTSDDTQAVIDAGAIPVLVECLSSAPTNVRENVVWALGNIAGGSRDFRDCVLVHGALPAVLAQMDEGGDVKMLRIVAWTLSNLCRAKPPPDMDTIRLMLGKLAELILSDDDEIMTDACWALSYLSDGPNVNIEAVIGAGVVPRCIALLLHHNATVQIPALRTVGNIVTGDDNQTQRVVDGGALPNLLALLGNARTGIRKEACWAVSNITAGSRAQVQAVLDANIVPALIRLFGVDELDVVKEAAWAISNATSGGSPEQISVLVDAGCIRPLCDLLERQHPKVVMVALEGLENILKAGREQGHEEYALQVEGAAGLDRLVRLLELGQADRDAVRLRAQRILDVHFEDYADPRREPRVPQIANGRAPATAPSCGCGLNGLYRYLFRR